MQKRKRSPDFSSLFPDRASYEGAIRENLQLASKMAATSAETISSDASKELLEAISQQKGNVNSRALSEAVLLNRRQQIVSSYSGRINDLLITVPWYWSKGYVEVDWLIERHYKALIAALGDYRTYTIVLHPDLEERITTWFSGLSGISLKFCYSPIFNYSQWAQDAYVALTDKKGGTILAEGVLFARQDDMTIADDIATQTETSVLQSSLYFQGGNILGGSDVTLIGEDYINRNINRVRTETRDKVIAAFEELFGTEILALGGEDSSDYDLLDRGVFSGYGLQPLFHIDMYVTRTGVVGPSGKEIVMLGTPRKAKDACGRYSEYDEFDNHSLDGYFRQTADQLSDRFEVIELPLFLTATSKDDFYWLTFNNVVIENSSQGKSVILPVYSPDLRESSPEHTLRLYLENSAIDAWERIGFTVKYMDGLEDLAEGEGSIHCITKTLDRSDLGPGA